MTSRLAFTAAWLILLACSIALSVLAAQHDTLPGDERIMSWAQDRAFPGQTFSDLVREITSTEAVLALGAVIAVLLWVTGYRWEAGLLALGLVLLPLVQGGLREIVDRPRPAEPLAELRAGFASTSFPAGHVMGPAFLYGFLLYLAASKSIASLLAWPVGIWSALVIVLAGPPNVWLGVHWPRDVFGECVGSFAEYGCAPAEQVMLKPATLTFEQAATVSVSGRAALQAVRDEGTVQPGQTVLVIGAAGGVGTFAIQIAKAFGAEVTGVCSTTKTDLVLSIGADHVIDYTREDFADGKRHYDVILDIAGNRGLSHPRRALTPEGTLVIVGGEEGGRWFGGMNRQLRAVLLSLFVRQTLRFQLPKEDFKDLAVLKELIDSGKVTPVIDRTYLLGDVPEAIRYLQEGRSRGKVVITM